MPPLNTSPVDEIKERLDVAEVLSEYVKLKPAGANRFKVLCPFHNEKTPSLMVSKDKQVWHCFGCGKGGDMFTFVQEIEGMEFPEALRILAKKANVELRSFDPKLQTAKTRLLDVLRISAAFYRKVLTDATGAEVARAYLRERRVSDDSAEDLQLGYSPTTWDALVTFLQKKGFQPPDAFDAGLVVKRDKGTGFYDRFRGRLMFPIRDLNGIVVGFGGRILESAEGDAASGAKYINTPETLVYGKSNVLYGLDRAKQAIKQADLAVLVEGYMDCIASHQADVNNVVAVSGTALTAPQVKLLKRYTNNLALAFDADLAGGEAASRGVEQALAAEMKVTMISIPAPAKDPDELIRDDPAKWRNAIGRSERIVDHAFNRAFTDVDLSNVDTKKAIAKKLLPVIARLPDPVEQSHYLHTLSEKLGTDEDALRDSLKRSQRRGAPGRRGQPSPEEPSSGDRGKLVAERLLALGMYTTDELFEELAEKLNPNFLTDPELQALYREAVLYYNEHHHLKHEEFRKHIARELPLLTNRIARIVMLAERDFSQVGEKEALWEFDNGVRFLRRNTIANELRTIEEELRKEELRSAEASGTTQKIDVLLRRMNELTDELRTLDS